MVAERFGEQRFIGASIDHEHDALERHQPSQLVKFEDAARVVARESSQIHHHHVTVVDEPRQHHLPRVVVAEELIDAKTAVAIRGGVALSHAMVQALLSVDETTGQPAGHEIEELVGLNRPAHQIDAGNHLDAADAPPVSADDVEQPFAVAPDRERSQQQQGRRGLRPARRRAQPRDTEACKELVGSKRRQTTEHPERTPEHQVHRMHEGKEHPDRVDGHRLVADFLGLIPASNPDQRGPSHDREQQEAQHQHRDERPGAAETEPRGHHDHVVKVAVAAADNRNQHVAADQGEQHEGENQRADRPDPARQEREQKHGRRQVIHGPRQEHLRPGQVGAPRHRERADRHQRQKVGAGHRRFGAPGRRRDDADRQHDGPGEHPDEEQKANRQDL